MTAYICHSDEKSSKPSYCLKAKTRKFDLCAVSGALVQKMLAVPIKFGNNLSSIRYSPINVASQRHFINHNIIKAVKDSWKMGMTKTTRWKKRGRKCNCLEYAKTWQI